MLQKMIPFRFITRIAVVFFIICAATENLPVSKYAQAQRINDDSSSSEEINNSILAGSGNSLPPNLKTKLTYPYADRLHLPRNWFRAWQAKQMAKQQQQQKGQRRHRQQRIIPQKHDFQIRNFAFPIERQNFPNDERNFKESSQRNEFVNHTRWRRSTRCCDYDDMNSHYDEIENGNDYKTYADDIEQENIQNGYATFLRNLFQIKPINQSPKSSDFDNDKFDANGNNEVRSFYLDQPSALYGYPEQNLNADFSDLPITRSQNYKRDEQLNEKINKKYIPSVSGGAISNLGDFFKELSQNIQFMEQSQLNKVKEELLNGHHPLKTLLEKLANNHDDKAGAMTNLGNFFKDLSRNVQFIEQSQLNKNEEEFLNGDQPLKTFNEKVANKHEANAEFVHAIRTYRPPQRVRSMISMTPYGHHSWQYIDPNYMWIGLGK